MIKHPHYSFMRPGDFGFFMLFTAMTAFAYYVASTTGEAYYLKWISYAVWMTIAVALYAVLRIKRRNLCDGMGETQFVLAMHLTHGSGFDVLFNTPDTAQEGILVVSLILLVWSVRLVIHAPKHALELRAALELAKQELPNAKLHDNL